MATKKEEKAKTYYIFVAYSDYDGWQSELAATKKQAINDWTENWNRNPVNGFFVQVQLQNPIAKEAEYPVYEIES